MVKNLANSALEFVEKFVKKAPSPASRSNAKRPNKENLDKGMSSFALLFTPLETMTKGNSMLFLE